MRKGGWNPFKGFGRSNKEAKAAVSTLRKDITAKEDALKQAEEEKKKKEEEIKRTQAEIESLEKAFKTEQANANAKFYHNITGGKSRRRKSKGGKSKSRKNRTRSMR